MREGVACSETATHSENHRYNEASKASTGVALIDDFRQLIPRDVAAELVAAAGPTPVSASSLHGTIAVEQLSESDLLNEFLQNQHSQQSQHVAEIQRLMIELIVEHEQRTLSLVEESINKGFANLKLSSGNIVKSSTSVDSPDRGAGLTLTMVPENSSADMSTERATSEAGSLFSGVRSSDTTKSSTEKAANENHSEKTPSDPCQPDVRDARIQPANKAKKEKSSKRRNNDFRSLNCTSA